MYEQETLTANWGNSVGMILSMTPGFLVVTSVTPDLWNSWFAPRLDKVALGRIAECTIDLDPLQPSEGLPLLEELLKPTVDALHLPTTIFPFTESDVNDIVTTSPNPRAFIECVGQLFDEWLEQPRARRTSYEYFVRYTNDAARFDAIRRLVDQHKREYDRRHRGVQSATGPRDTHIQRPRGFCHGRAVASNQ